MNKTVFITGATRGIGRELAKMLTELGCSVFATGRDEVLLKALEEESACQVAGADLSDPDQVVTVYKKAKEALGHIDILINNAGLNHAKDPVANIDLEDWELQYAVNLRAPFILCREAMKEMGERRNGHIINIVSSIAKTSQGNYALYSTMKYGLKGFTKCLIKEARELNVKVTAVYPGGTDTEFREARRSDYMAATSAAKMIVHCITAPEDVIVHDLTYRPMVESNF